MYFIRLSMILTTVAFFMGSVGLAQTTYDPTSIITYCEKEYKEDKRARENCIDRKLGQKPNDQCEQNLERVEKMRSEFYKKCGETGGRSNCIQTSFACLRGQESESANSSDYYSSILGSAGAATGNPLLSLFSNNPQTAQKKCSDLSRSDWNSERKTAKDELKSIKDKMERLAEKKSDAQEKLGDKQSDIMEKMNKLVEEGQRQEQDAKRRKREEEIEYTKQTSDIMRSIRNNNNQILQLQRQRAQAIAKRAEALISLHNSIVKAKCLAEIEKVRAAYKRSVSGGIGGASVMANQRQGSLKATYNQCLEAARNAREATVEDFNQQVKQIDAQIGDLRAEIQEGNELLQKHKNNRLQAQADDLDSEIKAKENLMMAQQKLMADFQQAQTVFESKRSEFLQATILAQLDLNQASADLFTLGDKPPGKSAGGDAFRELQNIYSFAVPFKDKTGKFTSCPGMESYYDWSRGIAEKIKKPDGSDFEVDSELTNNPGIE